MIRILEKETNVAVDSLGQLTNAVQEISLSVYNKVIEGSHASRFHSPQNKPLGEIDWTALGAIAGIVAAVVAILGFIYVLWKDWHNNGKVRTTLTAVSSKDFSSLPYVKVLVGITIGGLIGLVVGMFFGGIFKLSYEIIEPPFLSEVIKVSP
jgi:hypothetical protein